MVHLGRLKPPRKAAGQMDLLPAMVQTWEVQTGRAGLIYQPPLATAKALMIPQRKTGARYGERAKPMASCRTRVRSRPRGSARHLGKVRFASVILRDGDDVMAKLKSRNPRGGKGVII